MWLTRAKNPKARVLAEKFRVRDAKKLVGYLQSGCFWVRGFRVMIYLYHRPGG